MKILITVGNANAINRFRMLQEEHLSISGSCIQMPMTARQLSSSALLRSVVDMSDLPLASIVCHIPLSVCDDLSAPIVIPLPIMNVF